MTALGLLASRAAADAASVPASSAPDADRFARGPRSDVADEPLVAVAISPHSGRLPALLRAYLEGPGRGLFVLETPERAQALIGDLDDPVSREALQQFRASGSRPVVVLARRHPIWSGAIWVPKPVRLESLVQAARHLQRLRREGQAGHRLSLAGLPVDAAEEATESSGWRSGARPLRRGPYAAPCGYDWTARIPGLAVASLGIAFMVSVLGWQPAPPGFRAASPVLAFTPPPDAGPAQTGPEALARAVDAANRARPPLAQAEGLAVQTELMVQRSLAQEPQLGAALGLLGWPVEGLAGRRQALVLEGLVRSPAAKTGTAGDERAAQALHAAVEASVPWLSSEAGPRARQGL